MKWQAIYKDGSIHNEDELQSSEKIDRTMLREFRLIKDNKIVFLAKFKNENRKLIFRRRTFMTIKNEFKGVVYLVGWHENVRGVSIKSICYVYEDGHIEFDDDRNDLQLVPCEQ